MNRIFFLIIFTAIGAGYASAALTFSGNILPVIEIRPETSTGLEMIYVIDASAGVTATNTSGAAKWERFGSNGGAYSEEIASGAASVVLGSGDTGIIVSTGGRQYCYWIIDYSQHELSLRNLAIAPDQGDCDRTTLSLDGNARAIPFYNINGRREELGRELKLTYTSQIFNEESFAYETTTIETTLDGAGELFGVEAPLCDTAFTLTGDRFLRRWGREEQVSSQTYHTTAVAAETRATQTERDIDNEQTADTSGLGGSAPCEITFEAATSDGVIFREWQISRSSDFGIPENSFNEDSFTYTFDHQGTMYVRFVANNEAGTCEFTSQVYDIFIGESKLEIPNAFSPGASPGVNDIWKVSFKSLIEFECHIFNKWGTKMCSLTDPSQGWDGKYGGKLVPAGTYYYVIRAKGSDGIEYKKAGDINIINYTGSSTTGNENSGTSEPTSE